MGKIETDHTGSGGGITLSSDGTSLLLDGTAIGGSPDLYAENPSSATAPSATGTNAVAIGSGASATQRNSFSLGSNADATALESVAIGHNSTTSGSGNSVAIGVSANTSGWYASSFGFSAQATGNDSLAFGKSRASGTNSLAAAITSTSTSYGADAAFSLAIGYRAKASNSYAFAVGQNNIASGFASVALGRAGTASGNYSVTLGSQAIAAQQSKMAFSGGRFAADGDAQAGTFVLRSDTTNATAEALTTSNGTAGTTNQIILPNNSAYAFHGTIVAREQASAGTDCAAWKIEGLIRREGSAGTTVLVNSATTVLDNTPSWGMALSADTTNGGLKIQVTGAASTNIRWVATINTSEVTY